MNILIDFCVSRQGDCGKMVKTEGGETPTDSTITGAATATTGTSVAGAPVTTTATPAK